MSFIPPEDLLKYTNEARINPQAFARYVQLELDTFTDNNTLPLAPGLDRHVTEGKVAWVQAIDFLNKQKPLHPLKLNNWLCLVAEDHVMDMMKNGITNHKGSNGLMHRQRIDMKCGQSRGRSGQNISRDFLLQGRNNALTAIVKLIVDDGTPSRGHRNTIFREQFNFVGSHTQVINNQVITVQDFHEDDVGKAGKAANSGQNSNIFNSIENTLIKNKILLNKMFSMKSEDETPPIPVPSAEDTLKYINQARTQPKSFANYVKEEIQSFINDRLLPLHKNRPFTTREGKVCWKQAYDFLMNQHPLEPLKLHQGLCEAAEDHADELARDDDDLTDLDKRVLKRCGKLKGKISQNVFNDYVVEGRNTALKTVLHLIIDDGYLSRKHRENIFSQRFNYVGISSKIQKDKQFIVTVQDFYENPDEFNKIKKEERIINQTDSTLDKTMHIPIVQKETPIFQQEKQNHIERKKNANNKPVIIKSTHIKIHEHNGQKSKLTKVIYKYIDGTEQQFCNKGDNHH